MKLHKEIRIPGVGLLATLENDVPTVLGVTGIRQSTEVDGEPVNLDSEVRRVVLDVGTGETHAYLESSSLDRHEAELRTALYLACGWTRS